MGFLSRTLGGQSIVTLASGESTNAQPISINRGIKDLSSFPRGILEEDYRYDPMTFNIVNKNLQLMTHAGFQIKAKKARNQNTYDDFFESIGEVGEEVTKEELVEYILQDLLMYGNSYVELIYDRGDVNKKILDLRVIPEKYMDYAKTSDKNISLDKMGRPVGYVMKLPGGQSGRGKGDQVPKEYKEQVALDDNYVFFLPERIAHFKLFTYGDRFYGIGLIEAAHTSTYRKMKIEEARTNEIYTRGSNTVIASVGDDTHEPSPQDLERVLDNISNIKHDRYFAFPKWVDIKTLPVDENTATDRTLDYLRINQSSCAGMPMAIITGQGETANKQTLDTQQFILELSLESIINKFSRAFKKYVLKPISISNNISEVADIVFGDIVAEDKTSKNNRLTSAVLGGILAPEEVRSYMLGAEGLEPDEAAYKAFKESKKPIEKKPVKEIKEEEDDMEDAEEMSAKNLSKKAVNLGGFYMPDIKKRTNIGELDIQQTLDRHQKLHVLWSKLEDGYVVGWTFEELHMEHEQIIGRLDQLNVSHLSPINGLDRVNT